MDISYNISILMSQTTYTEEECIESLKKHSNDVLKCLKEYSGIKNKTDKGCVTSNQERYRLIRNLLDNKID